MELKLKDIYKSFAGKEVLHGVSFSVKSGKALGLLGRNGAGKTTTIRILMNLFNADKGKVLLDGEKFIPGNHQIGYLPEERGLYPKQKVLDQLLYLGQLRGLSKKVVNENALYWLERLEVEKYKDDKLETLSKGNQQKVQLAQTFVCNPEIVILDEPFSGLDPVNSKILQDIIIELIDEEKLLIFSSHQMNYVEEFCEEIALIDEGEIVLTGNLKEIKDDYSMNRLIISVAELSNEDLESTLKEKASNIATVVGREEEYLIVKLLEGNSRNDLLKLIIELNLNIERFASYEPRLSDIFVQKVGVEK